MRLLRYHILALLFLLLPERAHAQWPFELWHDGKIILESGDTLKGFVKYDLQQDLVQYTFQDKTAVVFTARKVLAFEIFDETVHKYRHFFSLPFGTSGDYKTPVFFELLEEGKLTLMAREFLEYKTVTSTYYTGSVAHLVMSHKYFFLKENGNIEEFKGKRNDLLDMMGRRSKEVEKYMRANRLKWENKNDLCKIISFYNSLSES